MSWGLGLRSVEQIIIIIMMIKKKPNLKKRLTVSFLFFLNTKNQKVMKDSLDQEIAEWRGLRCQCFAGGIVRR